MKQSYCPACGRNLALVGIAHQCGFPAPKPAAEPWVITWSPPPGYEPPKAEEIKPFDKKAYQREYMRKRRQKANASAV